MFCIRLVLGFLLTEHNIYIPRILSCQYTLHVVNRLNQTFMMHVII